MGEGRPAQPSASNTKIMKRFIQDILTAGKVLLRSGHPSASGSPEGHRRIIVMGNGPSLRQMIAERRETLMSADRMAVNFAANAPEYFELRPQYYILADPHFFAGAESDPNVARLWERLAQTDWEMTLFVPCRRGLVKAGGGKMAVRRLEDLLRRLPENLTVKRFNLTPAEGGGWLTDRLVGAGLAMPRPRNVLIPAIMMALREGYREVVLVGADHTWSRTLSVDDRNRVLSEQPHFYKDNEKELDRVAAEYAGYHLHDILGSLTIAFRSYFDVRRHAERLGARIVNATPGSFIGAFERISL